MRILFHAPVLSVHRPDPALSSILGVPPTVTDTLFGLKPAHKLTGNRGNIIHAEAPARSLRKDPDGSAVGNIANLQKNLGEGYAETIAEHFDMIVVSLANFIRPNHDGIRLFTALEALDGRVPFVVLGAGMQGSHAFTDLMPGNRDLLALLNERANLFGVRGTQTAEWLANNGLENTTVLGCPSLYVYPQSIMAIDGAAAQSKGRQANVMTAGHFSMRDGAIVERGTELAKAFDKIDASYVFQDEIFAYGKFITDRFGYNEGNNIAQPEMLNRWLSRKCGHKVDFNRYYYFSEAGAWRQAAMLHDVYIGDRFHGGVAALQAGQPAIFLKHDNRVAELTEHFGLPALNTQKFMRKGLKAVLDEYLSPEMLDTMKATYRQRHAEYVAALAAHGLEVDTIVPDEPQPVPAVDRQGHLGAIRSQKAPEEALPEGLWPTTTLTPSYAMRRLHPEDARELVVTFEGAGQALDRKDPLRPGFGERFLIKSGYAVLSVLPHQQNWYRPLDLEQYFRAPETRAWMAGFDKVHVLGSGMGAFGAMAFADLIGAENVVALQPITTLAEDLIPGEIRFPAARKLDWSGAYRDACAGCDKAARIYAIHGDHPLDLAHVARLQDALGARLISAELSHDSKRPVTPLLRAKRCLPRTALTCLRGGDTAALEQVLGALVQHKTPAE
ncbi:polysaccharide pyruvyl transferase family protein (plasmid) [Phaeobacter inhibens]|uniref:polysaccharide pyruvyl transferase family protein n=1 Tax=Phaeobacter inhibens TaxID=221822 RepID=UPI0021A8ADA9|nr:polysaccharide pyruvyl transferase family protein [Phaeobacter inhibens]UWR94427.1 polysaccharide pyruvyl transferase family protein [Phaeobacter inhibens]